MLGFNAISEVSIAELPGAFVPVSGINGTIGLGSVTTEGQGAADVTGVSATMSLCSLASVTGTANISITVLSAIGS